MNGPYIDRQLVRPAHLRTVFPLPLFPGKWESLRKIYLKRGIDHSNNIIAYMILLIVNDIPDGETGGVIPGIFYLSYE